MQEHLIITAINPGESSLFHDITERITLGGLLISECHFGRLVGSESFTLVLSGNWDGLAKIESSLGKLQKKHKHADICWARQTQEDGGKVKLPYVAEFMGSDRPGILHAINKFFVSRNIQIDAIASHTHSMEGKSGAVFSAHANLGLPADARISLLREEFVDFCDQENLDAVLEPVR